MSTFLLQNGILRATISDGQLTGFGTNNVEFMHKANQPGWSNSDTEMFPIIGPTSQMNYRIQLPAGEAVQDQHGLLRELEYKVRLQSKSELILVKSYTAGTPIPNSKYPGRSPVATLHWPYSFEFSKHFLLREKELKITFSISGDPEMPFMLGYHPAFNLMTTESNVEYFQKRIPIDDILKVGDRAMEVPNCNEIILHDLHSLKISTSGFGHFMLWTPDSGMLCIEPITFYPYNNSGLTSGFTVIGDRQPEFSVCFLPMSS